MADPTITTSEAPPAAPECSTQPAATPKAWRPTLDDVRMHVAHARALANMLAGIVSQSGIGDGEDLNDHTGQTQQAFALLDGLENNLWRIAQWMEDAQQVGRTVGQGDAA